jgi:hypothetical protein
MKLVERTNLKLLMEKILEISQKPKQLVLNQQQVRIILWTIQSQTLLSTLPTI